MQVVKGKKDNEKRDYCILLIIRQMTHTFWMIIGNAFRKLCQQQRKKKMTNIVTIFPLSKFPLSFFKNKMVMLKKLLVFDYSYILKY